MTSADDAMNEPFADPVDVEGVVDNGADVMDVVAEEAEDATWSRLLLTLGQWMSRNQWKQ